MKPVVNAAIAEAIVITYRDVRNGLNKDNPIPHFPLPSQYASVMIVYGALAFFPERGDSLAAMIGWGFVVATLLNVWTPGGKVKLATILAKSPTTQTATS